MAHEQKAAAVDLAPYISTLWSPSRPTAQPDPNEGKPGHCQLCDKRAAGVVVAHEAVETPG